YHDVKQRIEQTAVQCGRDPDDIQLLVVTKGHRPGLVREVISAGAGMLGENYVQEALEKMEFIEESGFVEWHMIGHI
ncbi:MAG: YggS family pyridoxal phosphate-dependent enzyme, partial [Aliifodinibius sp.]|nr:YggS family pyridoxal phosphate-dependent enzyme [Candidatus Saccharibacteria bacterium]NIT60538.1 YggS family pyridoxal phosphate-dependent enzyme [Fodinibius sp.]NIV15246.1 YggS family pyridoxal phosphate-dependent enzyme [Fodinibius sp.]NIY29120.1 YggS family pyridoxal phosphate-dependent enzyme [Fodinibius sp.]